MRKASMLQKSSILIIDDNPTNLKLIKVLLTLEGYRLKTATNAKEALKVLKSFRPELILMDIQLPDMDGLMLTRKLKSDPVHKELIILAITAYAMRGDKEKAISAGCDGFIIKPINTQDLSIIISHHLERKQEQLETKKKTPKR